MRMLRIAENAIHGLVAADSRMINTVLYLAINISLGKINITVFARVTSLTSLAADLFSVAMKIGNWDSTTRWKAGRFA